MINKGWQTFFAFLEKYALHFASICYFSPVAASDARQPIKSKMTNYQLIEKMRAELNSDRMEEALIFMSGENNADDTLGRDAEYNCDTREEWASLVIMSMQDLLCDASNEIREAFEKNYKIRP